MMQAMTTVIKKMRPKYKQSDTRRNRKHGDPKLGWSVRGLVWE